MAHVLKLKDGRTEVLMDLRDFCGLTDEYMGTDAKEWLEEYLADTYGEEEELAAMEEEHQKELDGIREHYHGVLEELRGQSEILAGLIRQPEIDRKAVSACAGKIGTVTWREM